MTQTTRTKPTAKKAATKKSPTAQVMKKAAAEAKSLLAPAKKKAAPKKTPTKSEPVVLLFKEVPLKQLFALAGRLYVKNGQGKVFLLPASAKITSKGVNGVDIRELEIVTIPQRTSVELK